MSSKISLTAMFLVTWLIFQATFNIGQFYQQTLINEKVIANIEKRVALDLPKLKLANPKFKTVADPSSIKVYLHDINIALQKLDSPLFLSSIQGISGDESKNPDLISVLHSPDLDVELGMAIFPSHLAQYISYLAPLMALFISYLFYFSRQQKPTKQIVENTEDNKTQLPKLLINLKNKSIKFESNDKEILLSNKPFCFYAALVDYCIQTQQPNLRHNSDVPDELLQIANKYFYRLIELGHTQRKRPDFAANLDKTLSEIRSALDEAFGNNIDCKELFYPPKAQGEGSRSKMHNYAISNQNSALVEFIGK